MENKILTEGMLDDLVSLLFYDDTPDDNANKGKAIFKTFISIGHVLASKDEWVKLSMCVGGYTASAWFKGNALAGSNLLSEHDE